MYGPGSLSEIGFQPFADDGIAHMEDEVGMWRLGIGAQEMLEMADGGEGRQCLVEDDDMAEEMVDTLVMETVGAELSEDDERALCLQKIVE